MNKIPHPFPSLVRAEWMPLRLCWEESPPGQAPPAVRWWSSGDYLTWEIRMPSSDDVSGAVLPVRKGFVEGLWEQDVGECFVLDRGSGRYVEYNLSPDGAWWACRHTGIRQRDPVQPDWMTAGIRTECDRGTTHRLARMTVPMPQPGDVAVNFTAIVTTRERRRFYSLAPLGGDRPDFHRPAEWLEVDCS